MKPFSRRIADSQNGPSTYVGPSTTISGKITGQGAYVFCGRVEGDCDIDGPVTLADGCHWTGTLRAEDVIVGGAVDGDVIAKQRVEVLGTAKITGSLSGNSIAVAEGAVIEGEIKVVSGAKPLKFEEKRSA